MDSQEGLILAIKLVFAVAAVVLLVAVVLIPIFRTLSAKPDYLDFSFNIREEEQEFELLEGGEKPEGEEKPTIQTMVDKARSDPRKTAALISQWIKDKR